MSDKGDNEALNDNLSINSDTKSNKSFLMKKFLENSDEIDIELKTLPSVKPPIPKPRKIKNNSNQNIINVSNNDSTISQKTYVVDNEVKTINNLQEVDVLVHHNINNSIPISSKKEAERSTEDLTDLGKTYVKSNSTDSSEKIRSTTSKLSKNVKPVNKKRMSNDVENDGSNKSINREFSYENIVEIIIHKTDALQIDSYVTHPVVKAHIVDINTGKYFLKSKQDRSVVFYYENEGQNYILPVMTSSYNLQEKRTFSPEWEESILLNEDFTYLTNENVIIFFEVLDYIPFMSKNFHKVQKYCYKGWHRITFAFLKLVGKNQALNVNKKVKLQLFYPKENRKRDPNVCDLWCLWKTKNIKKYPSALYVTIKGVTPPKKISTFRSKTPLQKENVSTMKHKQSLENTKTVTEKDVLTKIGSKGSKQTFKLPNKPLAELNSYDNGCFLLQFSNNGEYLACAVKIKGTFTVIVYEVKSLQEICSVNEHRGLIYSINWSIDDSLLVTASADNTVVIWNFCNQSFVQILPHPIYVYTSCITTDKKIIVTGCYDSTVRIWLYNEKEEKYELHQEMENHKGYVTSVCFNKLSTVLYSSDSIGCILEWSKLANSDWHCERNISTPDLQNTVINEIMLFPNQKKILVHSRDSILRILSVKRGCVLYWLQGALNSRVQTFSSITGCGNYITAGSENGLVVVWDAKTGKDILSYEPFLKHLHLETVHCVQFHPKNNLIAFCHYGNTIPILLYHHEKENQANDDDKLECISHYNVSRKFNEDLKEKKYFSDILEKMDKLLI